MRTKSIPLNGHKPQTNGDKPFRTPPAAHRRVNGNHRPPPSIVMPARAITSPTAKFMVGFIAGSSLVFMPPLVTSLAFHNADPSHVVLFNTSRVSLGMAVAVFIAILSTLQEYQRPARPWSIFMRALALPGLVIGSWQSLADTSQLRDKEQKLHAAEDYGEELTGIPKISDARTTEPIQQKRTAVVPDTGIRYASLLPLELFSAASPQLGASVDEPRYLIVLDRRPDSTAAAARAQELKSTCCPAAATRQESVSGWYVLESTESRTHTDALRRAVAIRNSYPDLRLAPQLLPLEK